MTELNLAFPDFDNTLSNEQLIRYNNETNTKDLSISQIKFEIFNKIRNLEDLFLQTSNNRNFTKFSTLEMLENNKFKKYTKNVYDYELEDLVNMNNSVTKLIEKLKNEQTNYDNIIHNIEKKNNDLKNILEKSGEILNIDLKENDEFFDEYKERLTYLIEKNNSELIEIKEKLNFNYNLFNLVKEINEKEYIRSKYICNICHQNEKNVFIDCGHTYCKDCINRVENNICPYCNTHFSKIERLYLN